SPMPPDAPKTMHPTEVQGFATIMMTSSSTAKLLSQSSDSTKPAAGLRIHAGGERDWSISREAAKFLKTVGGHDKVTLETGAGLSTIIFAQQGGQHICITPSGDEIARIR